MKNLVTRLLKLPNRKNMTGTEIGDVLGISKAQASRLLIIVNAMENPDTDETAKTYFKGLLNLVDANEITITQANTRYKAFIESNTPNLKPFVAKTNGVPASDQALISAINALAGATMVIGRLYNGNVNVSQDMVTQLRRSRRTLEKAIRYWEGIK
jgi:hypothetical protein